MKPKHIVCRLLLAVVVVMMTACVDKSFDLADVSTEVTVGQGTTTLPLGYLEKKSFGDLLGDEKLEGLNVDPETGDYSLSFTSDEEAVYFPSIDNTIYIPRTASAVNIDYPTFKLVGESYQVDEGMELNSLINGMPIPEIEWNVPAGQKIHVDEKDKVDYELTYTVPNVVKSIERVYLAAKPGEPGARVDAVVKFNDITPINGGGSVNIKLVAPATYEMYDEDYNLLDDNIFEVKDYQFAAGASEVHFTIYIASISNINTVENGTLNMPVEMEYELSYDMVTKADTVHIKSFPELHLKADLAFNDAEVVLNEVQLIEESDTMGESITIESMPDAVKSIQEVAFVEGTEMRIFADGLEWISKDVAKNMKARVQLPDYLYLVDNERVEYDEQKHVLQTSLYDMQQGINLGINSLTFAGEGLELKGGRLDIDFAASVKTYLEDGTRVRLSELEHEGDVALNAGFDAVELQVNSVTGKIDYYYERFEDIEIGDIGEGIDIQVNDIGLSPVIFINVDSPMSLSSYLTLTFVPTFDGVPDNERSRKLRDIPINPATKENGVLKNGVTHIIIADESRREEYSDAKYTFVPCDVASIFTGNKLPDNVSLDIEIETDARSNSTLYAADDYTIKFLYGADMPIAFDNTLDVVYSDTIGELSDTFSELSEQGIKVGDLALIAAITNTMPLGFSFDAELLDKDGNPSDVELRVVEDKSTIAGSPDGKTEVVSPVRLELSIGDDGALSALENVDALKFTLDATSAADGSVALNENQYLSLKLQVEIAGGITVDLSKFTDDDSDEF